MTRGGLQNAVQLVVASFQLLFSSKEDASAAAALRQLLRFSLLNMQKLCYSHSTHHVTRLKRRSLSLFPKSQSSSSSQFSKSSLGGSETNCDKARGSNSSTKKTTLYCYIQSPPLLGLLQSRTAGHAPLLLLLAPHSIGRYESIASPTGAVKLLCNSPFFSLKQRLDDDMTD